jgi:hypothetical protein
MYKVYIFLNGHWSYLEDFDRLLSQADIQNIFGPGKFKCVKE